MIAEHFVVSEFYDEYHPGKTIIQIAIPTATGVSTEPIRQTICCVVRKPLRGQGDLLPPAAPLNETNSAEKVRAAHPESGTP